MAKKGEPRHRHKHVAAPSSAGIGNGCSLSAELPTGHAEIP